MERLKLAHMKQNQVACLQVGTVVLHGARIVSLIIDAKERLCLAQISNTLLKEFSYNEIHNRRVALGITCVQCTPVQLEILRRAGAMPISSRRCGMITSREAERLCKSFLGDNSPPRLPDSFAFEIMHDCAWGCRGQFMPARYNSSRAKCIKCTFCSIFFSPNKFVFHSHRLAEGGKYIQPDAANFNSWRRHIQLLGDPPDEVVHAWEDVKAMFNGGTRKRMMSSSPMDRAISPMSHSPHDFSSMSSMIPPPPTKQVKLEVQPEKPAPEPSTLYDMPTIPPPKELQEYLWPRPPHYHLLWPGRPLPVLPTTKDSQPTDFSNVFTRTPQEPFFGLFFSNNNLAKQTKAGNAQKREDAISQFMDGPFFRPGFRESAFQPFKREDNSDSNNSEDIEKTKTKGDEERRRCTEEEDSEGDETVDIERIEDNEEDTGNSIPLALTQTKI